MTASIIVPSRSTRHLLERCLPALVRAAEKAGGDHEIIVADDGSRDDSAIFVRSHYPQVKLLPLHPAGFGRACNTAALHARGEVLVLVNSDVIVAPDFLPPLLGHLRDREVFSVGCKFLNPDGSLKNALGNHIRGEWRGGLLYLHHETDPRRLQHTCPQLFSPGGAMAVSREKFLSLGGFDHLYRPFYWEDVDLGYRAWKRGWRVIYEPNSVVYHDQGSTIRREADRGFIERVSTKNAYLFVWKNVSDRRLLLRHFSQLPARVAEDVLISGDGKYASALSLSLRQLSEVARKRAAEKGRQLVSDLAVLAQACGAER